MFNVLPLCVIHMKIPKRNIRELTKNKAGDKYICLKCQVTCRYLQLAKKHFFRDHKDFEYFRKLIVDSDFQNKITEASLKEIGSYISKTSAEDHKKLNLEIRDIHQQIYKMVEKFDQILKSDLEGAPTYIRKKHCMLKKLDDLGQKADNLLDLTEKPI